ncbi:MAG: glycosyltransferase [Candidatus Kapabacteria bacterium]|nr:glycosyltransferase [Candidatus Kapabacteria bacterium]
MQAASAINRSHTAYDVVVITLADLRTDARTMNIANALACSGLRVCALAPDWAERTTFPGIDTVYIATPRTGRLWKKWLAFTKAAMQAGSELGAKVLWAADLYSLKAAANLAALQRVRLIYDAREIYSALGPLHKHPFKQSLLSWHERRYARRADTITVSGELDAEYLRQHLRRNEKPSVIMNVPPYSEPKRSNALRERFAIPAGNPVAVYQGVLLEGRGIEPVIEALAFAPDLHFCIIGDGPHGERLRALAQRSPSAQRIHFLGAVPYSELLSWTASADTGVCFIEPVSFSYSLALPNKLFEYAMARIPCVVSDLPAMRRIIGDYPFGELIATDASPETIAIHLMKTARTKDAYTAAADRAARTFNREAQDDIIRSIISLVLRT